MTFSISFLLRSPSKRWIPLLPPPVPRPFETTFFLPPPHPPSLPPSLHLSTTSTASPLISVLEESLFPPYKLIRNVSRIVDTLLRGITPLREMCPFAGSNPLQPRPSTESKMDRDFFLSSFERWDGRGKCNGREWLSKMGETISNPSNWFERVNIDTLLFGIHRLLDLNFENGIFEVKFVEITRPDERSSFFLSYIYKDKFDSDS